MKNDELPWMIELDNIGGFAELDELQAIYNSIPVDQREHKNAYWLEGFIAGKFVEKESSTVII